VENDIVADYGLQSLRPDDEVYWDGKAHAGVTLYNQDGNHLSDVFRDYPNNDVFWFCCQSWDSLNETPPNFQDMLNDGKIKTAANGWTATQ
jgi:hypothetical protein